MMIMVITHSRLKYKSRFLTFTDKMFISAQGSRAALARHNMVRTLASTSVVTPLSYNETPRLT